jgi:hypothetical protein
MSCDKDSVVGSFQESGKADALAYPGFPSPSVHVTASASDTGYALSELAGAGAAVWWQVRIAQTASSPVSLPTIPTIFSAHGTASVNISSDSPSGASFGFGEANASAVILMDGFPLDAYAAHAEVSLSSGPASDSDSFTQAYVFGLEFGRAYDVGIRASCFVAPGTKKEPAPSTDYYTGSGGCTAAVDPTFMFDQAALDAQLGSNSFLLQDYFQIELSPNLIPGPGPTPAPEPTTLALLGIGMAGIKFARKRMGKQDQPSSPDEARRNPGEAPAIS